MTGVVRDSGARDVPVGDLPGRDPSAVPVAAPVEDLAGRRYALDALPAPHVLGLQYTLAGLTVPTPPFVLLDTETSGLPHQGGRVVELGAVAVGVDGALVSVFDSLVRCHDRSASAIEAFRVSGLDPWVLGDPSTPDAFTAWASFLAWSRQLPYGDGETWEVVAYNEPFDRGMMTMTFGPLGGVTLPWSGRCLQQTARDARPKGRKQFRLFEFAQSLGDVEGVLDAVEVAPGGRRVQVLDAAGAQRHRALPDAILSWRVWRVLWTLAGRPTRPKAAPGGAGRPRAADDDPLDPDIPF